MTVSAGPSGIFGKGESDMGREYELKYTANPQKIGEIQKKFGNFSPIVMETTYYDTSAGDFAARKWMLRCRLENNRAVCTIKTPLPDGSRGEWEVGSSQVEQAIPALCDLGAPRELLELAKQGLVPKCAARFTRLASTLEGSGFTLELALDQGEFLAGDRHQPFAEVEVELKSGSEIAVAAFAQALAQEFGLPVQTQSKAQRAFQLAQEENQEKENV